MERLPIDALFFDFDGTLGDTANGIRKAWLRTIAEAGMECPEFDRRFRVGPPADDMVRVLFPELDDVRQRELAAKYKFNYDTSDMEGENPYPHSREILEHFSACGKKLYVVTYKRMISTVALVKRYGFEKYFSGIWGCDVIPGQNLHKSKLLELAVRVSGADPDRCVMIGDTELDIRAAHEAGVHSCAVTWGYGPLQKLKEAQPELIADEKNFIGSFSDFFGCGGL